MFPSSKKSFNQIRRISVKKVWCSMNLTKIRMNRQINSLNIPMNMSHSKESDFIATPLKLVQSPLMTFQAMNKKSCVSPMQRKLSNYDESWDPIKKDMSLLSISLNLICFRIWRNARMGTRKLRAMPMFQPLIWKMFLRIFAL